MALAALAEVPWETEVTSDSRQGLLCGLEPSLDIGVNKSERVQTFHFAPNVAPRLDFYPAT